MTPIDRKLWAADPVTKYFIEQITENRYEIMECWARGVYSGSLTMDLERGVYSSTPMLEAEMRGQCVAISTVIDLIREIGGLDESTSGEPGDSEV